MDVEEKKDQITFSLASIKPKITKKKRTFIISSLFKNYKQRNMSLFVHIQDGISKILFIISCIIYNKKLI